MAAEITQDTAHATEASQGLPAQYVDASVMQAIAQTIGERAQYVENALWALLTESLPSSASTSGSQLDRFGALVGQSRAGGAYPAGETDALYRAKLAAAARRNRSAGTTEDLLGVLAVLLDGNLTIAVLLDTPPAAFVLLLIVTAPLTTAEQALVREFVGRTRAAGIGTSFAMAAGPVFGFGNPATYPWIDGWSTDWATYF